MCSAHTHHTHKDTHTRIPFKAHMYALNFALTFDFQLTLPNFEITFYLI